MFKKIPFAGGTYCEVWAGEWKKGGRGEGAGEEVSGKKAEVEKVALKALRLLKTPGRERKRLERELPKWAKLRHQNILPFYGIVTIEPRLYIVSPWRENGNLLVYVKSNPQAGKDYLLCGSAGGLSYLHTQDIVHGSVKCTNVFVSDEGEPQICDFGIATVAEEITKNAASGAVSLRDVVRFSAPELLGSEGGFPTTHSDIYSFAMLILECITEQEPYSNLSRDAAVVHAKIIKRQHPRRPDGQDQKKRVSDGLWDLMTRCWSVEPDRRPTMEHVHGFFLDQG